MSKLNGLKPEKVFQIFELLGSVPHGSGNTKQISDLIKKFGEDRGFYVYRDESDNVAIKVPATKGYEKEPAIIIQGHMDMVAVKTEDCDIDLEKDGLRLTTDGEWVWAEGTSLGGDDCVAVAIALAIADDKDVKHPALEILITSDEETNMLGARSFDMSVLDGRRLLNLDGEEEGVFTVSCAGGISCDFEFPFNVEMPLFPGNFYKIKISGLTGGHSGGEIHKQRANANKLMFRTLYSVLKDTDILICNVNGGEFLNVIPKSCTATVFVPKKGEAAFKKTVKAFEKTYKNEYATTDPNLTMTAEVTEYDGKALDRATTNRIIYCCASTPNGAVRMCPSIPGFVQTSLNMGVVRIDTTSCIVSTSVRSSVDSEKRMVIDQLTAVCTGCGAKPTVYRDYPGWEYAKKSPLRDKCVAAYKRLTGKEPIVTGVHAGLECGLFIEKLPGLDAVSMGPDLRDIHSVNEKLNVKSVENLYNLVCEILADK